MTMGKRIKECRASLGLTQPQLAEKLELSVDMVKQMEIDRKKPSLETLIKLTNIFSVSADYLLGTNNIESLEIRQWHVFQELANKYKIDLTDPKQIDALGELIRIVSQIKEDSLN